MPWNLKSDLEHHSLNKEEIFLMSYVFTGFYTAVKGFFMSGGGCIFMC